jgi:hypothetical protein
MVRAFKIVTVVTLLAFALHLSGIAALARTGPTDQASAGSFANGAVTGITSSPAQQKAVLAYWTREAIANAQPMTMPVDRGSPRVDEASLFESDPFVGQFGSSPSGGAAANADRIARTAYPQDWAMMRSDSPADALDLADSEGTSQVYTSYIVNQWAAAQTVYPHKWVGRLSFTTSGGTSYCSATAISGNVMVTAAHCLYDSTSNVWYSNWAFQPAYRNGSAPYGTFPWSSCEVLTAWINLSGSFAINSWTRYDIGLCEMGNNSAGQTLNNAVGWSGRQWNYGYVRHFHLLGYPFRDYNDNLLTNSGKFLRTCAAESFQQTTDTRGAGCNWSRGISGGPWMVGYAPGVVTGWVDGVNSGFYIGTQNLYGIRFTSNNIVVLCGAGYATC